MKKYIIVYKHELKRRPVWRYEVCFQNAHSLMEAVEEFQSNLLLPGKIIVSVTQINES